jgi:hypothetical protein
MLGVVLVPGLLAAGVGTLIFVGLDDLTGLGTFSLTVSGLPEFGSPYARDGSGGRSRSGSPPRCSGARRSTCSPSRCGRASSRGMVLLMRSFGAGVALLAIGFSEATRITTRRRCCSPARDALGPLISSPADWTVGALVLLVLCQEPGVCAVRSSSFRGGPCSRAVFVGARRGHGRCRAARAQPRARRSAMGIGAMTVASAQPAADLDAARPASGSAPTVSP